MSEKWAVVTGTSGQLGPVWVETLEELGFKVFSIDLPTYDIGKPEHVNGALIDFGNRKASILVLNAAIDNPPGSAASFHGNADKIIQVNLLGHCKIVEAFLPGMIENGGGTIIAISSIQGRIGADWRNYPPGFEKPVGYNLSKAALEQYVRSLTVQYGRHNVRACAVGFGPYDGGKLDQVFLGKFLKNVPLGRPISRQSVKAAMRFAVECPDFAGQTALVDGGYTIL